ncbi:hypothetical protein BS50DRAFT_679883 [Corynespora cassiicola Philippines]|uniref:Uncharacterized protein n=1 Tax=Corynespora cassiicola Philippines TaxID=1448308 RepID=A0A2T2NAR9_CORCC|nr:hypothetical protein BS50DRAFT_679883 [Corynespora cassiicola Philippines]
MRISHKMFQQMLHFFVGYKSPVDSNNPFPSVAQIDIFHNLDYISYRSLPNAKMLSKILISIAFLTAATQAVLPSVQLYSTDNCASGTQDGTFIPSQTTECQPIFGTPISNAQGARVQGRIDPGCTYQFFAFRNCTSNDNNFVNRTSASDPNECFAVRHHESIGVGSLLLVGNCVA